MIHKKDRTSVDPSLSGNWAQIRAWLEYKKYYYSKECVDELKKFLAYGKSTLQRTGRVT